jgi:hypothetical protein
LHFFEAFIPEWKRDRGLALASVITHKLNIIGINFLLDSEQLVHFLNKEDLSNPPD